MKTTLHNVLSKPTIADLVNKPKVGDVLVGTWGYEAKLATFVQVVAVSAKSVKVVELGQIHTGDWQDGTAMPIVDDTRGTPQSKVVKVRLDMNGKPTWYIKWQHCYLYLWKGNAITTYNHH